MPRGRRSQTTPRPLTTTAHSDTVPSTKASPESNRESTNAIAESNSIISSSQSAEVVKINPRNLEEKSKIASVQESIANCKEDTVPRQQLNRHGSLESHTIVNSIETMADADHINANGSKIDTNLSPCDKDYNEEKEFQRASKVFLLPFFKRISGYSQALFYFPCILTGNKSS